MYQFTQSQKAKTIVPWLAAVLGLALLFYLFPIFHIKALQQSRQQSAEAAFSPTAEVDTFWAKALDPSTSSKVDIGELIQLWNEDPAKAAERFGHTLGLSSSVSYLVSGVGQVVALENEVLTIALDLANAPEVQIDLGPVFGNAIRDGSAYFDINHYDNTQDYNSISAEINRRVEETIFPLIKEKAQAGMRLRFIGGFELSNTTRAPSRISLVPIEVEFL